jgi:hypothetical protein
MDCERRASISKSQFHLNVALTLVGHSLSSGLLKMTTEKTIQTGVNDKESEKASTMPN